MELDPVDGVFALVPVLDICKNSFMIKYVVR